MKLVKLVGENKNGDLQYPTKLGKMKEWVDSKFTLL